MVLCSGDPIRRDPKCVNDIRAEQIRVSKGKCLSQPLLGGFLGIHNVMVDVVGSRNQDSVDQVSSEDGVAGATLIVDSADGLLTILTIRACVQISAARFGRARKLAREDNSGFGESRRVNSVVDERSSQRDLPAAVTGGRSIGRKIAGQYCGCWKKRKVV